MSLCHYLFSIMYVGSLGQIIPQECDLSFHLSTTNTNNTVKFVGLTANDVDGYGTGTWNLLAVLFPMDHLSLQQASTTCWWIMQVQLCNCTLPTMRFPVLELATTRVIGENRRGVLVLPVGKQV